MQILKGQKATVNVHKTKKEEKKQKNIGIQKNILENYQKLFKKIF